MKNLRRCHFENVCFNASSSRVGWKQDMSSLVNIWVASLLPPKNYCPVTERVLLYLTINFLDLMGYHYYHFWKVALCELRHCFSKNTHKSKTSQPWLCHLLRSLIDQWGYVQYLVYYIIYRRSIVIMWLFFHYRPPRYMGEGFVVLQTADCKITYYQDEPGLWTFEFFISPFYTIWVITDTSQKVATSSLCFFSCYELRKLDRL